VTDERQGKAYDIGAEYGRAAGTWVFDGNTDRATYELVLKGIEDCDPEVMDMQPEPLSGEWAGQSIPELSERFDLDLEDDDVATAFECGYSDGYWNEVEATARGYLKVFE
jgi:hypothetical protein